MTKPLIKRFHFVKAPRWRRRRQTAFPPHSQQRMHPYRRLKRTWTQNRTPTNHPRRERLRLSPNILCWKVECADAHKRATGKENNASHNTRKERKQLYCTTHLGPYMKCTLFSDNDSSQRNWQDIRQGSGLHLHTAVLRRTYHDPPPSSPLLTFAGVSRNACSKRPSNPSR